MTNSTDFPPQLEALLRSLNEVERKRLSKIFASRSARAVHSSLDTELFVRDCYRSSAVMLTSVARYEGRTTMALILAAFTAALDNTRKVLLIDADVDSGRLGTIFNLPASNAGLCDVFDDAVSPNEAVHPTVLPNLFVTPLKSATNGAARFAPLKFQHFLNSIRDQFDLIVVDTPAGGQNRAVFSLGNIIKNVFLVVAYGGPTREQTGFLLDNLKRVEADIIGCVLNRREFVVPRFLYGVS